MTPTRPRLEPAVLDALVTASDRGMPTVGPGERAPVRGVDDVEGAIVDMLAGIGAAHATALIGWIEDHGPRPSRARSRAGTSFAAKLAGMDTLTAALFAHHGVDPLVVHAFSLIAGVFETVDDVGMEHGCSPREYASDDLEAAVSLAPGVRWSTDGILLVRALPHTVARGAIGGPLRRIASHPLLDLLDLTVEQAIPSPAGVELLTGHEGTAATLGDLLVLSPRGKTGRRR